MAPFIQSMRRLRNKFGLNSELLCSPRKETRFYSIDIKIHDKNGEFSN